MLDLELFSVFIALGAFVGFMAGLLGVGGGGIMVPALTSIFLWQKIPQEQVVHLALGTSMASIVVTSLSNLIAHHKQGGVRWQVVRSMAPGILIGTFSATYLVAILNAVYLAVFFSAFMFIVALQMISGAKPKPSRQLPKAPALAATGTGIGGISAIVSIGGGSLSVPFLYWHNVPLKQAIGTSAALGLPIAISGTLGYLYNGWQATGSEGLTFGYIYLPAVVSISLIGALFAPLGVKAAYRLPVATVKKVFAVLLFGLSLKMLVSVLG